MYALTKRKKPHGKPRLLGMHVLHEITFMIGKLGWPKVKVAGMFASQGNLV